MNVLDKIRAKIIDIQDKEKMPKQVCVVGSALLPLVVVALAVVAAIIIIAVLRHFQGVTLSEFPYCPWSEGCQIDRARR